MLQAEDTRPRVANDYLPTPHVHLTMVECVIQTMHERLGEPLSLGDMADMACLSPYYFNRIFHQVIGIPPGEFLSTLRLNMAKRLLLTTSLSVTDICFEVGYAAHGSFTTRFTQIVGVPPRHLRHVARNVAPPAFIELCDNRLLAPSLFPYMGGVSGHIRTMSPFKGVIFAGLFRRAIPQGSPIRCTLLSAPGPYHIGLVPDGRYFLLVAALPVSGDPYTYLMPQDNVLIGIQGPIIVRNGSVGDTIDVVLRPPRLTDPPIISALPFI